MEITAQELYSIVLKEYPDVLNVQQISKILGVSMKTVYRLIRDERLTCLKVGRAFRVPKARLLAYIKLWG